MAKTQIHGYVLCFLISATLSLGSSITLPDMVTNKPSITKYTATSATSEANGTKIVDVAATTATEGVVLYKVTASDGATCILLKTDGLITVYFTSYAGEEQADTYMVDGAVIEGNCKYEDTASMSITWNGYNMTWSFAKTPEGDRWYVSQIELTVSTLLVQFHSIRAHVLPEKTFKLSHSEMLFSTPVGESYACKESIVDLSFPEDEYNPASLSAKIYLRTFQLQPFVNNGSDFRPTFDCNAINRVQ